MKAAIIEIHVYCGSDIVGSRRAFIEKLNRLTAEGAEVIRVDGKSVDLNLLQINLNSDTLFGNNRILAIENFLSLPKSDLKDKLLKQLGSNTITPVFIWENKEIDKRTADSCPSNFIIQNFKLPNELFYFLDKIQPNNVGVSLEFLEKLRSSVDENYLFIMLVRQVRLLILAKYNKVDSLAVWQAGKLKKQATDFSEAQLLYTYRNLRDIDYRQKTSQSIGSYFDNIQFLLAGMSTSSC